MREKNFFVSYYMSRSPVYVQETDTLYSAIKAMKKFKVDAISVVNEDFAIIGCITKKKIKNILKLNLSKNINLFENIMVKDIIGKDKFPVIVYPNMEIEDAFSIMKYLNNTCIPVVNEPWEKKMVGVLWLEDILSIIKKLPV
ncbi:MAG: CBS domain-containing protein [bacterium]